MKTRPRDRWRPPSRQRSQKPRIRSVSGRPVRPWLTSQFIRSRRVESSMPLLCRAIVPGESVGGPLDALRLAAAGRRPLEYCPFLLALFPAKPRHGERDRSAGTAEKSFALGNHAAAILCGLSGLPAPDLGGVVLCR